MLVRARAPTSAEAVSDRDRRTRRRSRLDAGRLERSLAVGVVADACDLPLPQHHDLVEARHEALGPEPLEPASAELDEDTIAELDHLPGAKPVRMRAPEQRAHDVLRVLARLPCAFARRMPGDVVVQTLPQRAMVGTPRELEDLLDRIRV